MVDQVYVLNMEKRPERLEHFHAECERVGFKPNNLQVFNAVDGTNIPHTDDRLNYIKRLLKPGEIGCALSHFEMWRDIVKNDYKYALILEDDVVFNDNFVENLNSLMGDLPLGTWIVQIGVLHSHTSGQTPPSSVELTKSVSIGKKYNPGTFSYILSKEGATQLIQEIEKNGIKIGIHHVMNDFFRDNNKFYVSSVALCDVQLSLGSDVRDQESVQNKVVTQINKIDRFYVISLARKPERLQYFMKECKQKKVDASMVVPFKAVDGSLLKENDERQKYFCDDHLNQGEKGCALSHMTIWEEMIKEDLQYVVVFEDDIIFLKNFYVQLANLMLNLPKDAWLLQLGISPYQKIRCTPHIIRKINDYVGYGQQKFDPGTFAYLITKEGAQQLINHINEDGIHRSIDAYINEFLKDQHKFYVANDMPCGVNMLLGSDIRETIN